MLTTERPTTAGFASAALSELALTVPDAPRPAAKPTDPELRSALNEYLDTQRRTSPGFSQAAMARQIGVNESALSRYLADTFTGAVDVFESKAWAMLRAWELRQSVQQEVAPFETLVTRQLRTFFDALQRHPMIGLAHGDAGLGKTSGVALYLKSDASVLFVNVSEIKGKGAPALVRQLWRQAGLRKFHRRGEMDRREHLADTLRGSKRLLIVDNAHLLARSGRQFLIDLHDDTGCAIALVGNEKLEKDWAALDQLHSRIGHMMEVSLVRRSGPAAEREDPLKSAVQHFLDRVIPDHANALFAPALQVARKHGHLRALWHQTQLTQYVMEADHKSVAKQAKDLGIPEAEAAFRIAHSRLVRDYTLEVAA